MKNTKKNTPPAKARGLNPTKAPGLLRFVMSARPAAERFPFWLFVLPILVFAAVEAFSQITCLDVWWHIKTGEWIWQHQQFPRTDPFSFTAAGQPWIAHEWLFGVAAYQVFHNLGLTGLLACQCLVIAGVLALTAWVARERGASSGATVMVLALAYAMCRTRFYPRPELISLCLAVGILLVYEKSRRNSRLLLLVPIFQWLWANIHGGTAFLGWALAGFFWLDQAFRSRERGTPWIQGLWKKGTAAYLAAVAAVVAVSFLNPYTWRALFYGAMRTKSPINIEEFQSLAETVRSFGFNVAVVSFAAFVVIMVVVFLVRRREVRVCEWLLASALLILSLCFFRFRPLFGFLLTPSIAWLLSRSKWRDRLRWWAPALIAAVPLVCIVYADSRSYAYRFGPGVHKTVLPVDAGEFVKQSGMSGRMFNDYGFGGYLIWKLDPGLKVFIDGREDIYVAAGIANDYQDSVQNPQHWRSLADKYAVDFAIVRYPSVPPQSPELSLETLAFGRSEWALVYFDDLAVIYVRRNGKNDEIIRNHEIRTVQPLQLSTYLDEIVRDPGRMALFVKEMDGNLSRHPDSFRAHSTLGILAIKRGPEFFPQGIEEFRKTIAINPEFAPAYANLGSIYIALGRRAEAMDLFKKYLASRDNEGIRQQLEQLQSAR